MDERSKDREPQPDAQDGVPRLPPPDVFWKHEAITCMCVTHGTYNTEVRLSLDGLVIQREFFADAESASMFALAKRRAYTGA
jgi:hypothetical protein